MTGPVKINHVSANYTELYFASTVSSAQNAYSISINCIRKPISAVVKDFGVLVLTFIKL